jgi:tetratricopeptide (TPR) repeat protein
LNLRRLDGDNFELIHPKCVEEMRPDYEEGLEIWKAGEPDEARDALRYALQGCGDNMWVHVALGRIALEAGKDPALARGHFGYAFELARKALPADFNGRLPPNRAANRPFYDAIDGLIVCHEALGQSNEAQEIRSLARRLIGQER